MTQQSTRIAAVIFDWAGTMIDYGSRAPASVFQQVFSRAGVAVTDAQAREPMGMAKRDHIAAVARLPEVDRRWREAFGRAADEHDVDRMYEQFLPLQKEVLAAHSELIPGAIETFRWCREQGIRVGSSTGYTRELMEVVKPLAAAAGYEPEVILCAEDAPAGRPAPWLIFECAKRLGVYPMNRIVKVDDTTLGIEAGINAGTWTVGVSETGNLIGLSEPQWQSLDAAERAERSAAAEQRLRQSGAHFVIPSVAELPAVIAAINDRLASDGPAAVPATMPAQR